GQELGGFLHAEVLNHEHIEKLLVRFGGVVFLQSAAHEIGVRTLTEQPTRLSDLLDRRRAGYMAQVAEMRARVTHEYLEGKSLMSSVSALLGIQSTNWTPQTICR